MRVPGFGSLLVAIVVPAVSVSTALPLIAQESAVITGRVTSAERAEPLGGANVLIANTTFGATTNANGQYTLNVPGSAVRGQQVVLTARYIGHKPATRTITLSAGEQVQDFQLLSDPLRLDEVVVTGVAGETDRRKLSFAVGSVSADQLQQVPGNNALVAIQGKVAGLSVVPNTAQPGGEVSVRLRGATSISGRQDPLIVVDGVITRFGLADIAAEDVERVEVVKGAAASSLYGSNGANGVVQVFTKRGTSLAEGTLRVTARTEGGVNSMPRRMEFSRSHAWRVDANGDYILSATRARIAEPNAIADNPFPVYHDHWDAMVNSGAFWTGYLSMGQRRGSTNFNASFQNTRNGGVIFGLGGYDRQNFRLNLDQQLRPNVDASWSAFYGASTNGRAAEGAGSPFFGLMFLQPDVDITAPNADGTPFNAIVPLSGDVANDFNPLYELANRKIDQDRSRFTGSGRLRWRIRDWVSAEGTFGYDQEAETYKDHTPFGYLTSSGQKTQGTLVEQSLNNYQYNTGMTLTSVRRFGSGITNTTKLGTLYESQRNRSLADTAGALVVGRVPEFGGVDQATAGAIRVGSRDEQIRNLNFFGITTFDIRDRYVVDALVRRDGSSLFGPENRWATYYRVSGAWRVTEDVPIAGLDELRLRGSYGTAGLRPNYDDQYEILQVTPGGFRKDLLGNPFLKPARSAELELGTNLEFGGGRYSLEYTYAQKKTTDQILLVDAPALSGFRSGQWQNTGSLRSRTHELTFAARLINRPSTSLTLNIVGDRTRQVITDWDLPERLYAFGQMPAAFWLSKGSNLGAIYGNRWVTSVDELYDDPLKAALSGAGQEWSPDSVMINEDGYVVRRSTYGTRNERAIKYAFCKRSDASGNCMETSETVQIGDANPNFNLSFGTTLSHRRFAVNALVSWSQGGKLYNGTRQWAFQATRDRVQDQAGKPTNDALCGAGPSGITVPTDPMPSCPQKALGYYGVGFYNGLESNDFFIEDGSYLKLKELSVNYTLVPEQLRRIGLRGMQEVRVGVIGRNLFTITNYSGLDPEISGLEGDPFQVRMDWFQYPQFRTFTVFVELAF